MPLDTTQQAVAETVINLCKRGMPYATAQRVADAGYHAATAAIEAIAEHSHCGVGDEEERMAARHLALILIRDVAIANDKLVKTFIEERGADQLSSAALAEFAQERGFAE